MVLPGFYRALCSQGAKRCEKNEEIFPTAAALRRAADENLPMIEKQLSQVFRNN
jgi:hypothetical protein